MQHASSIWEQEIFLSPQDFIVIGSGLVGLWCAWELQSKFPSARITILEKGIVPSGASTRNAGFACFGSPTELIADLQQLGAERVWTIAAMRFKGIEKTRQLFGDSSIDFENSGGYECLDEAAGRKVQEHLDLLNHGMASITGKAQTFSWCNEKLNTLGLSGFKYLVQNDLEGGLHSGKLVQAFMHRVKNAGVTILTGVKVNQVQDGAGGMIVHTDTDHQFKAATVLYCTNAFTSELLPATNITPARGQVLVTSPIENLQLKGTFHYDEGFYYFRNVGNSVLIGGARNRAFDEEQTTTWNTTDTIQQELERFLADHVLKGARYTIQIRWSGTMGFTANKQPLIEPIGNNALVINACNGMGVALSPMVAEQVAAYF